MTTRLANSRQPPEPKGQLHYPRRATIFASDRRLGLLRGTVEQKSPILRESRPIRIHRDFATLESGLFQKLDCLGELSMKHNDDLSGLDGQGRLYVFEHLLHDRPYERAVKEDDERGIGKAIVYGI